MLKVYIIQSQQLKLMIKSQFEHNDKLVSLRRTVVSPGCVMERYILNLLDCNMTRRSDKETSYQNYSILRISHSDNIGTSEQGRPHQSLYFIHYLLYVLLYNFW